jgi:NAD(P)-dependent dehydrogenase (short-subunit alcohol dehydrogenase family)
MPSPASAEPRVVVITGATSGIGLEVARGVAARGAHTVLVGRGEERTRAIAEAVARASGNPRVEAVGVHDLALRAEWAHLAEELRRRFPAIHVLVNNAGAYFARRDVTMDGIERTLALNVLAPVALTTLLVDRLQSSAPARVVNVASAAHGGNVVDLDDLESRQHYNGYRAYGRSKLELILLTRELARRLRGSGVTVNALHPGFIRSGFGQNNGGGTAFMIRIAARLGAKSVQQGATTPIRLALDSDVGLATGEYFVAGKVAPGSAASRDLELAKRLYAACLPLLDLPPLPEPPDLPPAPREPDPALLPLAWMRPGSGT